MKRLAVMTSIAAAMLFIFSSSSVPADMTAGNFAVYNINGERFLFYKIIDSLPDGAKLIVNFTSVTCLPCKREIPELKSMARSSGGSIHLMCIYAEAALSAGPSAESLGISDSAYVDPFGNIQKMFKVDSYPVTFVIDKEYKILGRFDGYSEGNIKEIRSICGLK